MHIRGYEVCTYGGRVERRLIPTEGGREVGGDALRVGGGVHGERGESVGSEALEVEEIVLAGANRLPGDGVRVEGFPGVAASRGAAPGRGGHSRLPLFRTGHCHPRARG